MAKKSTEDKKVNLEGVVEYGKMRESSAYEFVKEALKEDDKDALYIACAEYVDSVDFLDSLNESFEYGSFETVDNPKVEEKEIRSIRVAGSEDGEDWEELKLTDEQKEELAKMIEDEASDDEIGAYLDSTLEDKPSIEDSESLSALFHKLGDFFED